MKIQTRDILALSQTIKETLELYEVKPSFKESLLEDILFKFSAFIDEYQNTSIHESILEELENYIPPKGDFLVCELFIELGSRETLESNILLSDIENDGCLRLNLEVLLDLRDTSELDAEIDCESKFKEITIIRAHLETLDGHKVQLSKVHMSLKDLENEIRTTAPSAL